MKRGESESVKKYGILTEKTGKKAKKKKNDPNEEDTKGKEEKKFKGENFQKRNARCSCGWLKENFVF